MAAGLAADECVQAALGEPSPIGVAPIDGRIDRALSASALVAPGTECIALTRSRWPRAEFRRRHPCPWTGAMASTRLASGRGRQPERRHTPRRRSCDSTIRPPTLGFLPPSPDRPAVVRVKAQDVGSGFDARESSSGAAGRINLDEPSSRSRTRTGSPRRSMTSTSGTGSMTCALVPWISLATSARPIGARTGRAPRWRCPSASRRVFASGNGSGFGREEPTASVGTASSSSRSRAAATGAPSCCADASRVPVGIHSPVATSQVLEQTHLPSAPWRPIATLRTSKTGRFTFRALRGPSRTLRFRFNGSDTIRGRTADRADWASAPRSSMSVDRHRVVNGEGVTFRGRLRGRPFPASGKLVEVQARARGRWLTFGTTRAHATNGTLVAPLPVLGDARQRPLSVPRHGSRRSRAIPTKRGRRARSTVSVRGL